MAQNWHICPNFGFIWPNIGIFGTFDPMADQKTMPTRCLVCPLCGYHDFRLRFLAQNWLNFSKICFIGHIQALLVHLVAYWLVGWWLWRAGCIFMTPIYFMYVMYLINLMYLVMYIYYVSCVSEAIQHLVPCATKKTMQTRCLDGFLICRHQNFCFLSK